MSLIQMREILQAAAPIKGQAAPMPAVGPVLNEEAIKDWKKKDVLARRILLTTIEPKLQNTLNAMFQPQDASYYTASHGTPYTGGGTQQNKGHRGRGGFGNRSNSGGSSTGARASEGPAAKKPRYGGPPCGYCTSNGFNGAASHPTIECRKRATAERTRQDAANAAFTSSPKVDFGYPACSGYLNRVDANVWNADSGSTSHLTDQKQFLRNFVAVTPGSWVIKGIGNATALVHGYGDVVIDSFVNNKIRTGIIKNTSNRNSLGVQSKARSSNYSTTVQLNGYRPGFFFLLQEGWAIYPTIIVHQLMRKKSSAALISWIFDTWDMSPFSRMRML
ncbi:hypothetical protein GHT06_017065 [Daphnia sinensis]|uniref:Uncharacterized protein n=1 Tax=Daphnia sinensis TaxID=1820382 RepID=A0AAD5KR31_9CRUS|nr:hypothetical protein GHT06_017065 [Daphnia sinensis]